MESGMTPGSFGIETAKDMVGDARCRVIESDARDAANAGRGEPTEGVLRGPGSTYFDQAMANMESRIWIHAHHKRTERMARLRAEGA